MTVSLPIYVEFWDGTPCLRLRLTPCPTEATIQTTIPAQPNQHLQPAPSSATLGEDIWVTQKTNNQWTQKTSAWSELMRQQQNKRRNQSHKQALLWPWRSPHPCIQTTTRASHIQPAQMKRPISKATFKIKASHLLTALWKWLYHPEKAIRRHWS